MPPGCSIADGGLGGVLEIKEHDVQVTINNGVAVTEVDAGLPQHREPRRSRRSTPSRCRKGASVANFSMWINGKEMVGEVVEKQRAREIYDSYKQQQRDPGLLEQTDYKTFEMRIFPIAAGAEQQVQITYYQELDFDHDWATYVYPLATATRAGRRRAHARGRFALTLDVQVRGADRRDGEPQPRGRLRRSPSTRRLLRRRAWRPTGGDLQPRRRARLPPRAAAHRPRPRSPRAPDGEDGYFCLTLTAGEELRSATSGMDYVFVLDVSGSMADDGKLALSQRVARRVHRRARREDRFEVIDLQRRSRSRCSASCEPADDAAKRAGGRASSASQQARGGTVLRAGAATPPTATRDAGPPAQRRHPLATA